MLHEIMRKMFSNLKPLNVLPSNKTVLIKPDDVIAETFVHVEPEQIYEGEELQIFITVKNVMVKLINFL